MNRDDEVRKRQMWDTAAARLAKMIATMKRGHVLILSSRNDRYVQIAAGGKKGFRAETINRYLPVSEKLDAAKLGMLDILGWHRPTLLPGVRDLAVDQDGSPNHHVDFEWPVDDVSLAKLTIETLIRVHGLQDPLDLQLLAFNGRGTEIPLAEELRDRKPSEDPAYFEW